MNLNYLHYTKKTLNIFGNLYLQWWNYIQYVCYLMLSFQVVLEIVQKFVDSLEQDCSGVSSFAVGFPGDWFGVEE